MLQEEDELELVADAPHPDGVDEDPELHRKSDRHGTMWHTQTFAFSAFSAVVLSSEVLELVEFSKLILLLQF